MIDGSKKCNCQLAFELQNLHVIRGKGLNIFLFRFCQMTRRKDILTCLEPQADQAMVGNKAAHFMTHTVASASFSMECLSKTLGQDQDKSTIDHITSLCYQKAMKSHT